MSDAPPKVGSWSFEGESSIHVTLMAPEDGGVLLDVDGEVDTEGLIHVYLTKAQRVELAMALLTDVSSN